MAITDFKPMKATDAALSRLHFPLLASPKLDGIRAVVRNGVVYSGGNKQIPNEHVQHKFKGLEHFDGELICGDPCSKTVYRDTLSVVMSAHKPADDVRFYAFDHVEHVGQPYHQRAQTLAAAVAKDPTETVCLLERRRVHDLDELLAYEESCLDQGYEGLIMRATDAPYKCGRSTVSEGYLLKLKRFDDAEATVIGFEERTKNNNEKFTNALGRGQRSSHAAGKSGRGDLGALIARTHDGIEFAIGTGFDDLERSHVWEHRSEYLGSLVKFKFFAIGMKEAPRHPVFLGWRDRSDT